MNGSPTRKTKVCNADGCAAGPDMQGSLAGSCAADLGDGKILLVICKQSATSFTKVSAIYNYATGNTAIVSGKRKHLIQ